MKKVIFIIPDQFGYSAGYPEYAKYLSKNNWKVSIICVDKGLRKVSPPKEVKLEYIDCLNIGVLRFALSFIWGIMSTIGKYKNETCIIKYSPLVFFIVLFNWSNNYILDIRTKTINDNYYRRKILDSLLRFETLFFKHIFILSYELASSLGLKKNRVVAIPLGSEVYSKRKKDYSKLKLLYVGTLNCREIDKVVYGIKLFCRRFPNVPISLDIVGYGSDLETNRLKIAIVNTGLSDKIKFHGRKICEELPIYFCKNNVGVSFIPITEFYQHQPPTKTIEYIISGLFCIATKTKANERLITSENGILVSDTAESFANGLETILQNRNSFDSFKISQGLSEFTWENIVNNNLIPTLLLIEKHV